MSGLSETTRRILAWWDWHLGVVVQPLAVDMRPGCVVWTLRGAPDDIDRLVRYESDLIYAVVECYHRPHLAAVVERIDSVTARVGIGAPRSLPTSGAIASVANGNGPNFNDGRVSGLLEPGGASWA